ncbi:phosphotransferase [Hydrocarboniphaga sp.]|uniref:phosphotransferase n=1 Tax=Hydrocarboniphaga sp. TaxID=2033016 RepID=UPI003D0D77DA
MFPKDQDRVPQRWEDITPAWLNDALAARCAGAVVQQVDIVHRDDGTNRRAVLQLSYSRGSGPRTLFLKANDPAHRAVHLRNGNLFNEALLFGANVPLPVEHPIVYRAIADQQRGDFLLVMEDLKQRDADPRDALRPMSAEQVADGLRGLARLHSQYWGFSADRHPQLGWIKTWEASEGWLVGLRRRIPIGLERAAGLLPDSLPHYDGEQILEFWRRYVASLSEHPMTLLHGDAHIGNTYIVPGGQVGFLDWQVVRRGEWSQDVGYFLVGALTEADRRRHERELVQIYRDALDVPAAERPSAEQMWRRYRATPAYGLAIWLSTLGTDGWQAPAISIALAQRYAAAFSDLDSASVLAG